MLLVHPKYIKKIILFIYFINVLFFFFWNETQELWRRRFTSWPSSTSSRTMTRRKKLHTLPKLWNTGWVAKTHRDNLSDGVDGGLARRIRLEPQQQHQHQGTVHPSGVWILFWLKFSEPPYCESSLWILSFSFPMFRFYPPPPSRTYWTPADRRCRRWIETREMLRINSRWSKQSFAGARQGRNCAIKQTRFTWRFSCKHK